MMLSMIEMSMEQLRDSLNEKLISWKRYHSVTSKLDQHQNKDVAQLYDILIQAALFSEQGISTQELLSVLNTNYATLGKRLGIVKDQDLLIAEKSENKKFYSIKLKELDDILLES
jgi:hypothetical protein